MVWCVPSLPGRNWCEKKSRARPNIFIFSILPTLNWHIWKYIWTIHYKFTRQSEKTISLFIYKNIQRSSGTGGAPVAVPGEPKVCCASTSSSGSPPSLSSSASSASSSSYNETLFYVSFLYCMRTDRTSALSTSAFPGNGKLTPEIILIRIVQNICKEKPFSRHCRRVWSSISSNFVKLDSSRPEDKLFHE